MEERATALGGTLTTISARGTGTVVRLDCPVPPAGLRIGAKAAS
jgi:hypothetical protein